MVDGRLGGLAIDAGGESGHDGEAFVDESAQDAPRAGSVRPRGLAGRDHCYRAGGDEVP